MKQLTILALGLFVLVSSACRSDDDGGSNDIFFELRHDGNNVTGPLLPAGYNELAARFTRDDVAPVVGGQLERIQVFLGRIPQQVEIVVYDEGTPSTPGQVLFESDVTANVTTTGLQEFRLANPIDIANREIWISVGVLLAAQSNSVGCDDGPAAIGGDMLLRSTDINWTTFQAATNESVNWNIRGIVRRPE